VPTCQKIFVKFYVVIMHFLAKFLLGYSMHSVNRGRASLFSESATGSRWTATHYVSNGPT